MNRNRNTGTCSEVGEVALLLQPIAAVGRALLRKQHVHDVDGVALRLRVDVGKEVHYCLDEAERELLLDRIEAEKKTGKITVTRFKGLGEMNPSQLRETTMAKETRRLVQLTVEGKTMDEAREVLDKLLAKKRASDRRDWLQDKGNLADLGVDSAG